MRRTASALALGGVLAFVVAARWCTRRAPEDGGITAPTLTTVADKRADDGVLLVQVRDADTHQPLVARITIAALDDPSSTPTVIDAGGDLTARRRAGRYRITASRGLEWSIDSELVVLARGAELVVELEPRHVVASVGLVACNLELHGGFSGGAGEARATTDARVLSLASAGIELAATGEDEAVGEYGAALSRTDLTRRLTMVTAEQVTSKLRASDPLLAFDPQWIAAGGRNAAASWPGYPRTYVDIGMWEQGYAGAPLDPDRVFDALRHGRAFVTSGPMIAFTIGDVQPGGSMARRSRLSAHLRVRAAPWIELTSLEVLGDGSTLYLHALAPRAAVVGKEPGSPDEAALRTVRFDADITFSVPAGVRSLVAVVRGEQAYGDVLPGIDARPLAVTHPITLVGR